MLVDNPNTQSHFAPPPSMSMFQGYSNEPEMSEFFHTEMWDSVASGSTHSSSPSGSRESTPQNLMTPPQDVAPSSFPDVHDSDNEPNLFNTFDDPLKGLDINMASTSLFQFDSTFASALPSYGHMDMAGMNFGFGMAMSDPVMTAGINPSQIDTPPASAEQPEEESSEVATESPAAAPEPTAEKPTIVIAPVKAGGHGKARKGTVQSGGVVKKSTGLHKEKENPASAFASSSKKTQNPVVPTTLFTTSMPSPHPSKAESEAGDNEDDDDLPHDWRPSPEVFAKMTSKEKRQLRNKISARNFRVRRKEYISTLEGDIAERDRMLDHYRSQLSSHESENIALRQEIAALKKALLEGRGGTVVLPPPAPLPEQSVAEQLAAAAAASASAASSQSSAALLTPNTQKDLPTSPRLSGSANRFWGGVAGAGFTPVHTTLVPEVADVVGRKALQENMNPSMNAQPAAPAAQKPLPGFDGFADLNPFTMKTLDAYRMHLWGKMASQHHAHQQHLHQMQQQQAPGLSAGLRPHYFAGANKQGATTNAVLSGKHAYPSPPATPVLSAKGLSSANKEREIQQQKEKVQQQAMLAAMASQTVFRKLGSAFWEAFSGSSPSAQNWDQEKVQRVLEGKAVLRVVDVEPPAPKVAPKVTRPILTTSRSYDDAKSCHLTDILEESMRCLSIGKKV